MIYVPVKKEEQKTGEKKLQMPRPPIVGSTIPIFLGAGVPSYRLGIGSAREP